MGMTESPFTSTIAAFRRFCRRFQAWGQTAQNSQRVRSRPRLEQLQGPCWVECALEDYGAAVAWIVERARREAGIALAVPVQGRQRGRRTRHCTAEDSARSPGRSLDSHGLLRINDSSYLNNKQISLLTTETYLHLQT